MVGLSRFCTHGNLRLTCKLCKSETVQEAVVRAATNRARGESGSIGRVEGTALHYPWQREGFEAWREGGRNGLVALSLGIPAGDLTYEVLADVVNGNPSLNVLFAVAPSDVESVRRTLSERFSLHPSSISDHHYLEPREEGSLVVADLEELQTVELENWGRFASNGLLVLLDADGVNPLLGERLLGTPFRFRFCLSRKPSAVDLLISRPWVKAFGSLVYRYTEEQARDIGVLPRIHYKCHVAMLRPEPRSEEHGPEGPWDPSDIPTRLPSVSAGPFAKGRARDAASERAAGQEGVVVIHDGTPVKGARETLGLRALPEKYEDAPSCWFLAEPAADQRAVLRLATTAWKTLQAPGAVEDVVVLPVAADLCNTPPWEEKWRLAAVQLDRVIAGLLLAEAPAEAMAVEDLESVVGVALALRGIPAEDLHDLTPVVARAAAIAHEGLSVDPQEVQDAARAHSGIAGALLVAAESGPFHLLRLATPRFTPGVPDLPHPGLYDARRHAWRGKAFMALARAADKGDLITAWGNHPELRFVFPSSALLESASAYCKRHKFKSPMDAFSLKRVPDRTEIAAGDVEAASAALKEWSDALGMAEEYERQYLADMHHRQPERERRREGLALTELRVINKDRDTVVLETRRARFPPTNISPGCEVSFVASGDRRELGRGLVSRLSTRRIIVECPAGSPYQLPDKVTVNLTFDAKVFEAYHTAILGARRALSASTPRDEGPDGLIRAALLGETPAPESLRQEFAAPNLTASQRQSIEEVLSGGRVRLIHGPPGTGKTHTLVHLAMALTRAGHSVLVTADSNAAVDNMVVGLRRGGAPVVRVGHSPNLRDPAAEPARIDPSDAPAFVRWAAEQGIVVATTNYGAFRYIDPKGGMTPFVFDYVIHDEAGQSTAPSSLAAALRGRRLVLAGDPKQLPPTVVAIDAKDAGLDRTLFERIEELTGPDRTTLLRTQFRMREPIVAFSNKRYYEGKIETAPSAASQEGIEELPAAAFQHVTGRENPRQRNGSISNDYEADCMRHMVQKYRTEIRDRGWTMAVLTPYQAQREKLRQFLPDVEISTVDGAQGREWDVVFYSSVRSNPRHRLGFLADERRLNVAVTRAKRHFVLVGDERTLRSHEGFDQYVEGSTKIRMFYPEKDGRIGVPPKAGAVPHRPRSAGDSDRYSSFNQSSRAPAPKPARTPEPAASSNAPAADAGKRKRKRRRRRRTGDDELGAPEEGRVDEQRRDRRSSDAGSSRGRQDGRDRRDERPLRGEPVVSPAADEDPVPREGRPPRRTFHVPEAGEADKRPGRPPRSESARGVDRRERSDGSASRSPSAPAKPSAAEPETNPASKPASKPVSKPAPKLASKSAKMPAPKEVAAGGKCQAKTQAGSPCKNNAKPGSRFCGRHGG